MKTNKKLEKGSVMHYGIVGMGPVGATFAALLAASGKQVSVLDNNPHRAEVLRRKPLKVTGHYTKEMQLERVCTTFDEFASANPDVVLVCVKTHALQDLLARIKSSGLAEKFIVSCQNGIDTEKEIAVVLGAEHAFRIVLNFGVSYHGTHEISVNFLNEPHYLSAVSPEQVLVAHRIASDFEEAGVRMEYVEDITKEVFKKAILNACLSSLCTLTRMTMSEAMAEPELQRMIREMLRESLWICKASDIHIEEDFPEKAIAYLSRGGNHKPSMLIDIEHERQTEVRHLAGKLFEYAERRAIPIPVTQSMFFLIKSLEKSVMLRKYVQTSAE